MHPPTHTRHSTISLGLQANRKLGELQELGHELAVELAGTRRQHAGQTQTLDTLRESVAEGAMSERECDEEVSGLLQLLPPPLQAWTS